MNATPQSAKSKKELAAAYNISVKTLKRKLERHNIDAPGQMIYPATLTQVYMLLGNPFSPIENGQKRTITDRSGQHRNA